MSELALTEPIEDVLGKWKLTTGKRPLNAATALFTKDTGMYTQFTMRLARFQGTDKNEFIDNRRLEGNIFVLQACEFDEWIENQIRQNPHITTEKLAKMSKKGLRTVKRHIANMPHIRYVGSGYSGHWEVIDKG